MSEPTHHTTYNGPVFNQEGPQNIGINYGSVGATQDPELRAAVENLIGRLHDLDDHLGPEQTRTVEETLPVLARGRAATVSERTHALDRLGQIAAVIGPVAQPLTAALARLAGLG
ncbi:hypothetical protein [Streptomyces sp. NPDC060198]|uniref:hypothetical protein n=1 Tax=Streptomyces sp. NPDC060198 TaxID=3347070 RepID=UPI003658EB51